MTGEEQVVEGVKPSGRSTLIRPLCTMKLQVVRSEAGVVPLVTKPADIPSL